MLLPPLLLVHTDHLGTPRAVANGSTILWRWEGDAFGTAAANEDVDADSHAFVQPLRFPGQYKDAESGLNYNYFRDYNPSTGRYVQSDPIGLSGGLNTYSYALNNPLYHADPYGLDTEAMMLALPVAVAAAMADTPLPGPGDVLAAGILLGTLAMPSSTPADGPMEMAAPGNVADSQIVRDYGEAAAKARECGGKAPDKCEWLDQNKNNYRPDQVKATQKAWGCRRSRQGR